MLEQVICKQSMLNPAFLSRVAPVFKKEYIEDPDVAITMSHIVDFFTVTNKAPNKTEIRVQCSDDKELEAVERVFSSFDKLDDTFQLDSLTTFTEQRFRERATWLTITDLVTTLSDSKTKVPDPEMLDKVSKAANISMIDNIGMDFFEDVDAFCDRLSEINKTIPTGFGWLDNMLGGGWMEDGRALYVFAGQTNVGKSIILGQVAASAVKAGKNVLLISLEMSEHMYAKRVTAHLAKQDVNHLIDHVAEIKSDLSVMRQSGCGRLIIKEFPTRSATVSRIRTYIEEVIRNGVEPDLVVVDYVNLLSTGRHGLSTYEEGRILTEQLRALSYVFECSFVTATQLNRSGFGKENPGLDTISDSVGLSYTCDAQMSLWQTDEDKQLGVINMGMQKSRFGQNSGKIPLKIDYPTMTVTELNSNVSSLITPTATKVKSVGSAIDDLFDFA